MGSASKSYTWMLNIWRFMCIFVKLFLSTDRTKMHAMLFSHFGLYLDRSSFKCVGNDGEMFSTAISTTHKKNFCSNLLRNEDMCFWISVNMASTTRSLFDWIQVSSEPFYFDYIKMGHLLLFVFQGDFSEWESSCTKTMHFPSYHMGSGLFMSSLKG